MPFDTLSPELVDILAKKGITEPTEPQKDAIPRIGRGDNLLLVAPTGIGKTESAMLPILDNIFRTKEKNIGIRCLYITPLRALNRDMMKRIHDYGAGLGISVGVRHGDTPQSERNHQSQHPPTVMITTPETIQVLFTGKRLREHLKCLEWVVIDEIHELAGTERGAQLSIALERMVSISGEFKRIGLSATVGNIQDVRDFLMGAKRTAHISKFDTKRDFDIRVERPLTETDAQLLDRLQSDGDILGVMKRARELIENGRSTLFFVNTRETAEWLAARYHMWDEDFSVEVHHGSLSKENRMEMEDRFKEQDIKCLICTSSLELGIDIGSADLVIQYNSPREVSRMIQRAGRAGHRIGGMIRSAILASNPDELAEAMVIARRSVIRRVECNSGRKNPLSVLANQLIGMTMAGKITKDEAFRIVTRAKPFETLSRKDFDETLEQLKGIKMLFEDEDGFRRSRKGMDYFYQNISMIPDERTYAVRDIATRRIIGTLDESFVATFEEFQTFIAKGHNWRVIEMREDELLVEETKEVGSVPAWTGSDIPVPFEVAMEVGKMRRLRNFDDYPCDGPTKDTLRQYLEEQDSRWKMPCDSLITLEVENNLAILNVCFGTKVNETIGKIYSALLSARLGESVGVTVDAYRIILELPRCVDSKILLDTFLGIRPGTVDALARMTILNSSYLKWRFVHVAKKFGIIEKHADHRFMNFNKLFKLHEGTPVYRDAVNLVLDQDLDVKNTESVVSMIADGVIKVAVTGVSHIGYTGISVSKELMQPARADHSILMALKKRLEDEVLYATCLNCGAQNRIRVKDAPKRFGCDACGGHVIALLKEYDRDIVKEAKKNPTANSKLYKKAQLSANLTGTNGCRAAMVLAARGVGPENASRILGKMHVDEDAFLRDIMQAEITYAKNKRFWD